MEAAKEGRNQRSASQSKNQLTITFNVLGRWGEEGVSKTGLHRLEIQANPGSIDREKRVGKLLRTGLQ